MCVLDYHERGSHLCSLWSGLLTVLMCAPHFAAIITVTFHSHQAGKASRRSRGQGNWHWPTLTARGMRALIRSGSLDLLTSTFLPSVWACLRLTYRPLCPQMHRKKDVSVPTYRCHNPGCHQVPATGAAGESEAHSRSTVERTHLTLTFYGLEV